MKVNNMFYDKDFRQKVRQLDEESLKQAMAGYLEDTQIKVLVNTKDTLYFVIPDASLDVGLESIQAARDGRFGGHGPSLDNTIGTFGSFGCASSTISTSGTAGSLGTLGK